MYCIKCGTKLQDGVTFCSQCGTAAVGAEKADQTAQVIKWGIRILCVALVIVAIFWGLSRGVHASPENVVEAAVRSEFEADIELMVKCVPDFVIRQWAQDCGLPSDASRSEVRDAIEYDYRFVQLEEIEIIKIEVVDTRDVDELYMFMDIYETTQEEYDSIQQVAYVELIVEHSGERIDETVRCVQMKGKWYFLP